MALCICIVPFYRLWMYVVNTRYKIIIVSILIITVNMITAEVASANDGNATGEIDHHTFKISIPSQMRVGEPHTVKVFVRNTGDTTNTFRVTLTSHETKTTSKVFTGGMFPTGEFISPRYDSSVIVLKGGEARRLEFNIVPIKPYIGNLDVSADLFLVRSKQFLPGDLILLDTASEEIRVIKSAFTEEEQILIKAIIIIIFASIFITLFIKKK